MFRRPTRRRGHNEDSTRQVAATEHSKRERQEDPKPLLIDRIHRKHEPHGAIHVRQADWRRDVWERFPCHRKGDGGKGIFSFLSVQCVLLFLLIVSHCIRFALSFRFCTLLTQRAIKRIKEDTFFDWQQVRDLRELRAVMRAGYHPYMLQLLEVHRSAQHSLHLVLEYMPDGSLADFLNHQCHINNLPSDSFVRRTLAQVLWALEHMHSVGWIHRDVKPDNLLLRGDVCKLADFSVARPIRSTDKSERLSQWFPHA